MSFQGDSIFWVEVSKVIPNPFQPRREFDEDKLRELADSIRMYGILQPLTVTKKEIHRDDGAFYSEYELIAGERRLRASRLAGLEQVPVIIRSGKDTEQEKLELAIIENLQREDLNAVDRALAFRQLADAFELSHTQVAKKVGRSREYVSNTIRLLLLPEYMLASIKTGDISEGHARSLLMLKERPEEQDVVYREILLKKLSVREVERITRKIASDKVRKKNWVNTDPELIEIEREFTDTLGTRVQISKTDYGGKLTIDYFSEDDLKNLLSLVKTPGQMPAGVSVPEVVGTTTVVTQLTDATPLESVSEDTPFTPVPEEAPEMTEEVSDDMPNSMATEEVFAESPQAPFSEVDVADTSKVETVYQPPSASPSAAPVQSPQFSAEDHTVVAAEASVSESKPVSVPQPHIPTPEDSQAVLSQKVETPSNDPDDDLYSIRNFSL